MTKPVWQKACDEMGWTHWIDTGVGEYIVKVEKSPGGDYYVTALHPDDPAGGDIKYLPNLRVAKKFAEQILANGEWIEYTMFPVAEEALKSMVQP